MASLRAVPLRQLCRFSTSSRCRIDASIGATPENSLPRPSRYKRRPTNASQVASSRGPPILKSPALRPPPSEAFVIPPMDPSAKLPYHVLRTASQQLPVYRDIKRGGTLELTVIRKVLGDLNALRDDMQKFLRLPDDKIILNTLTKQVKIKGYYKPQVEQFLESRNL